MSTGHRTSIISVVLHTVLGNRKTVALSLIVLLIITSNAAFIAFIPVLFAQGVDALAQGKYQDGTVLILSYAGGLLMASCVTQLNWVTFGPLGLRIQRELTNYSFNKVLLIDSERMSEYTSHEVSKIIERGLDAARNITSNFAFFVVPIIVEFLISAILIILYTDAFIAGLIAVSLFIYALIAQKSASIIRDLSYKAISAHIAAWRFGFDLVVNYEQVKALGMRTSLLKRLDEELIVTDGIWNRSFATRAKYGTVQAVVFGVVVIGVLAFSALHVAESEITVGALVLVNAYIIRLLQPVETFARIYREIQGSVGEASLLVKLLNEDTEAEYRETIHLTQPPHIHVSSSSLTVASKCLFNDLSFTVEAGSTLFLVGPSGSGKSTLLRYIATSRHNDDFHIFFNHLKFDGNTHVLSPGSIALVEQECLLFDWSLRENVSLGLANNAAEVDDTMRALGLNEVAERHRRDGEPTVGERGRRLSGGEKQRVALARSVLRKPMLLLLDEPTSALDSNNRHRLMDVIENMALRPTVIIATHDTHLLEKSSKVLCLLGDGGYLLGTHSDLLGNSRYSSMLNQS